MLVNYTKAPNTNIDIFTHQIIAEMKENGLQLFFNCAVLTVLMFAVDYEFEFINTSGNFAIPIGGERVTWGCLNRCL